jgi:hypothetical protein
VPDSGSSGNASAAHDAQRRLVHELLAWRRDLLGLEDLVQLPPDRRLPGGEELATLEAMLALRPGFVGELRRLDGPFAGLDADAALAAHDATNPPPAERVPICPRCARPVALLIRRHDLPLVLAPAADPLCLCEGATTDDTALLFRLALEVAGRPRTLVLGGNAHIDTALRHVKRTRVHVVRDNIRLDPKAVAGVDLLVVARGLTLHKTTNPYTEAIKALPATTRPVEIRPRQPNANTVALAIVEERAKIRAHLRQARA